MIEFDMLVMIVIIGIVIVARLVWARWLSLFLKRSTSYVTYLRIVNVPMATSAAKTRMPPFESPIFTIVQSWKRMAEKVEEEYCITTVSSYHSFFVKAQHGCQLSCQTMYFQSAERQTSS
jgi:hypothetical protein